MNDLITGIIWNREQRRKLGWRRSKHWERPHQERSVTLRKVGLVSGTTAVLALTLTTKTLATGIGGIVFDPTNYVENLRSALQSVMQVENQYTQITNQLQQLANEAKNLTGSSTNLRSQILASYQNITNMQNYINGLVTDYGVAMGVWDQNYPGFASYNGMSASTYGTTVKRMIQLGNDQIKASYQTNALIGKNSETHQSNLSTLLTASGSAQGTLAALQVEHQIAALQCQQLEDLITVVRQSSNAQNAYLENQTQLNMKQQVDIDSFNSLDTRSPIVDPFDDPMLN